MRATDCKAERGRAIASIDAMWKRRWPLAFDRLLLSKYGIFYEPNRKDCDFKDLVYTKCPPVDMNGIHGLVELARFKRSKK